MYKAVWDYVPVPKQGSKDFIKDQISKYTDPTNQSAISAVADLIKSNIHTIIDELVKLKKLKKA